MEKRKWREGGAGPASLILTAQAFELQGATLQGATPNLAPPQSVMHAGAEKTRAPLEPGRRPALHTASSNRSAPTKQRPALATRHSPFTRSILPNRLKTCSRVRSEGCETKFPIHRLRWAAATAAEGGALGFGWVGGGGGAGQSVPTGQGLQWHAKQGQGAGFLALMPRTP